MEIPDKHRGDLIVNFYQNALGGIGMVVYPIDEIRLYRQDTSEMQAEGWKFFAEFEGVNQDFVAKAGFCLEKIDRSRLYRPGDVSIDLILKDQ